MTSSRVQRVSAGVWAMVPFAALLGAATLWQAPARVPTHWSSDLPDGFSTGAGVFTVTVSIAGFCAVAAALVAALAVVVPALWSRWIVTVLAGVAAAAAATYGAAAWGTHLAGTAEKVHVIWSIAPFVIGILWAVVAYLLHRTEPVDRQAVIDTVPERSRVVPVRGGDVVPWATVARSGTLFGTAIFVAVVLTVTTVLAWISSLWLGLFVAVVSVAAVAFTAAWSRVEIQVDDAGLVLQSLVLPVPVLRVAVEDVVGVEVADLDPMKWGGIGLRWLPDRSAYIVRGGPGIVVHRASGRRLGIEIPEGEEVAAAGTHALLQSAGRALAAGRGSTAG
ncbi:hypothetical protein NF556_04035 [Ornithinimicrobium faecis]|uniref:DUF1648 domain-containing protein n=1 Tax=Ornithinimicrobium faecis TaxID=2934158 RepID=A0ABY4YVQ1_9MICO|nr:hypothetical protein [Ornithinimicrobium sp. HY1793]USQ80833.1 hypothetical protein NF556_04035 [Ornithinimicrobium sp. HY1793]